MTDHDALLAAVLRDPADDLPRLVLADWWDEHGQTERAEFCRVQCELGPLRMHGHGAGDPHGGDCRQCFRAAVIERRERELFENGHTYRWGYPQGVNCTPFPAEYAKGLGPDVPVGLIRRGFVEAVSCDLATLFGGPCLACGQSPTGQPLCHTCSGAGTTPGAAPRLFGTQPVTRVTLTDTVIHPSGGDMTYYVGGLGRFPREYWNSLVNLPSRRAALDALSEACVAWGRDKAGLPPLARKPKPVKPTPRSALT